MIINDIEGMCQAVWLGNVEGACKGTEECSIAHDEHGWTMICWMSFSNAWLGAGILHLQLS